MLKQTIVHHTALAKSGGATRVARLLLEGLEQDVREVLHSYEASENAGDKLLSPEKSAQNIPENAIVHLHSSADPANFLRALPETVNVIITLHDTQMITGGCSYPLNCAYFTQECRNPCPRNFPDSQGVRKKNISALLSSKAILISPSRWLAKQARECDERLSVKIIPNGIPWPVSIGNKKRARKEFGLHPASKVVLFIAHGGQSAGYKSGPMWDEYWNIIKRKVPEAIAFAIGGDKNNRVGDFISIPYVDRETLSRFMLAADVFAYPTLADNHPLIVLEAMSNGLATVSYAVGGVTEQIVHGKNGILIPPYEKETFADNVASLLTNSSQRREIGLNGHHNGKKRYQSARMIRDYMKIYDKMA